MQAILTPRLQNVLQLSCLMSQATERQVRQNTNQTFLEAGAKEPIPPHCSLCSSCAKEFCFPQVASVVIAELGNLILQQPGEQRALKISCFFQLERKGPNSQAKLHFPHLLTHLQHRRQRALMCTGVSLKTSFIRIFIGPQKISH